MGAVLAGSHLKPHNIIVHGGKPSVQVKQMLLYQPEQNTKTSMISKVTVTVGASGDAEFCVLFLKDNPTVPLSLSDIVQAGKIEKRDLNHPLVRMVDEAMMLIRHTKPSVLPVIS